MSGEKHKGSWEELMSLHVYLLKSGILVATVKVREVEGVICIQDTLHLITTNAEDSSHYRAVM